MTHDAPQSNPLSHLRTCLDQAIRIPGIPAEELERLRQRTQAGVFNLVVLGEFKRGKSSLVNALLGAQVLPVGVVPLTAIATLVSYGEVPEVEVLFESGARQAISPDELATYVTEKGNPRNRRGVREVHIRWPSPWLADGVRLVDTPGIGSVYAHNGEVTYRFLPQADAVLFVLSVDQPAGKAETEFLAEVRAYAGRIFFLLNKADLLSTAELEESLSFAAEVIGEALGRPAPLFPVSARQALRAIADDDPSLLEASRFPAFTEALGRFLMEEKGNALAAALGKRALRLVLQTRTTIELELSSLRTPVEELARKVALFEARRAEVEQEKRDFSILLETEVKALADRTVTADVEAFRERLGPQVEAAVRQGFQEARGLPLKDLTRSLEETSVTEVRNAWDGFRQTEDQLIGERFQAICARFAGRIDATADELYRFSSELFAVRFENIGAENAWRNEADFYYKFWDEPTALKTLTSALPRLLPRVLGAPLILRQARRYALELADTQAGRVRYDFARRLERGMNDFERAMLGHLDATLDGIEAAVKKGLETGADSAARAERRATELQERLAQLDGLAECLRER